MQEDRVQEFISARIPGIKVIKLEDDTSTSELAARALGTEVGQIAKSIVFRSGDDYFMVVAAGDTRLDSKRLKELKGKRARMATAEEVLAVTGYEPGGVCPFALPHALTVYADESLKRFPVVYAAAGSAHSAVPVTYDQLVQLTGALPCNVGVDADCRDLEGGKGEGA